MLIGGRARALTHIATKSIHAQFMSSGGDARNLWAD